MENRERPPVIRASDDLIFMVRLPFQSITGKVFIKLKHRGKYPEAHRIGREGKWYIHIGLDNIE